MRRLVSAALLLLFGATVVFASAAKDITSTEAKAMLERSKNVYLLDVRTQDERQQGYIAGSVLIPISMIEKRIAEVPKNRPVIVYCAVGSRSRAVAQALAGRGYPEVYNMRDGIFGWYRSGLPIQK